MSSRTEHGYKIIHNRKTKDRFMAELVLCELAGTMDGQSVVVCVGEIDKQNTSGKPLVTFPHADTPEDKEAQWILANAIAEWLNLMLPDTLRTMAKGKQIPEGFGEKYITVRKMRDDECDLR
jgi:hypothetical protein